MTSYIKGGYSLLSKVTNLPISLLQKHPLNVYTSNISSALQAQYCLLVPGGVLQDLQWMPEASDTTSLIHAVLFSYARQRDGLHGWGEVSLGTSYNNA